MECATDKVVEAFRSVQPDSAIRPGYEGIADAIVVIDGVATPVDIATTPRPTGHVQIDAYAGIMDESDREAWNNMSIDQLAEEEGGKA